ncbi:MAG: endonuclease NucS [Thermoleophilia bacterium]|nr:endonuclease NucS [Thermoleophilia bacterium]
MRLIIARCEVHYAGRVTALLPMAVRVVMWKSDGSIMVHSDAGGYKPQNWMTPPTRITETPDGITVEKGSGTKIERLQIVIDEVLSDSNHDMGDDIRLEKDGIERDLQEALADAPHVLGVGFRLIRREYPTPIGPVDLLCTDDDGYVAVEVKRVGTIDAVEQLTRYLDYIRADRGLEDCRGMLVAESMKPQARTLATDRDIATATVDLAVVRGEKAPDLTLFDEA